jgi:hypothetical protein
MTRSTTIETDNKIQNDLQKPEGPKLSSVLILDPDSFI